MTTTAQYASNPYVGGCTLTAGDSSRTAPVAYGVAAMAGVTGARIDNLDIAALGPTPTASQLRLFLAPGNVGATISGISYVSSTVTVTTTTSHGMVTGTIINMSGCYPVEYNGIFSITVTGAATFTYTASPSINPTTLGTYSYSKASPTLQLLRETSITSVAAPGSSTPVFETNLNTNSNPDIFPIILPPGWNIRASMQDTQVAVAANINGICLSQTIGSNSYGVLNGALATAANTAAVAALQTTGGAGYLTLTSSPYSMLNPAMVTLTSTGNISAVNFTIIGTDTTGATITETIAGPNNSTVYFTKVYSTVLSVYVNGVVGTNTSVGYSAVTTFSQMTPVAVTSVNNLSAITFTITGTKANGQVQSESFLGPTVGTIVTSANTYKSLTAVSVNSIANGVIVGIPAFVTGIEVTSRGGSF
jgi:VCBS repeat-containing protein